MENWIYDITMEFMGAFMGAFMVAGLAGVYFVIFPIMFSAFKEHAIWKGRDDDKILRRAAWSIAIMSLCAGCVNCYYTYDHFTDFAEQKAGHLVAFASRSPLHAGAARAELASRGINTRAEATNFAMHDVVADARNRVKKLRAERLDALIHDRLLSGPGGFPRSSATPSMTLASLFHSHGASGSAGGNNRRDASSNDTHN